MINGKHGQAQYICIAQGSQLGLGKCKRRYTALFRRRATTMLYLGWTGAGTRHGRLARTAMGGYFRD